MQEVKKRVWVISVILVVVIILVVVLSLCFAFFNGGVSNRDLLLEMGLVMELVSK